MAGQSIGDRLVAAQHTIMGSDLARIICKATTSEVGPPKKKHLDYLLSMTHEPNIEILELANILIDRTRQLKWVIVFKALITTHHLMILGNERFLQHLASRNVLFTLNHFVDKNGVMGFEMSAFVRRYANYLNQKAISYRNVAKDFTRAKRGAEGYMRSLSGDELLKTLPLMQAQLDALVAFDADEKSFTNGIMTAAFSLLFKDLIRLFAGYNDGIINLLEKFYDMKKGQCKEAVDIYKKFLIRMNKVSDMLKVAEHVGIDQKEIPDLSHAPSSLLDALEQHVSSFDSKKGEIKQQPPVAKSQIDALKSLDTSLSRVENDAMDLVFVGDKSDSEASPGPPRHSNAFADSFVQKAAAASSNATSPSVDLLDVFSDIGTSGPVPNDLFSEVISPASTPQPYPFSLPAQQPYCGADLLQQPQPVFSPSPTKEITGDLFGAFCDSSSTVSRGEDILAEFNLLQPITSTAVTDKAISPNSSKPQSSLVNLESSLANLQANLEVKREKANLDFQPKEFKLTGGAKFSRLPTSSNTTMTTNPITGVQPSTIFGVPAMGNTQPASTASNLFGAPMMSNMQMPQPQQGSVFQPQTPQGRPFSPNNPFL